MILQKERSKKTVLVTGAPHTKGLQICRILKAGGHKIILADMKKFEFSASRFSWCVDKWVTLPNMAPSPDSSLGYKKKIKDLVKTENVDWWIPVSHTNTAVIDTMIKEELEEEESKVKVLSVDSVKTAEMLDDKISFLEEAKGLSLPVPEFFKISSCQDVQNLWRQGKFSQKHFFMKPLNPYSEDRVCFDRIPNCEKELLRFLKHYESRISPTSPYFVSEFIQGREWTGNIIANSGKIFIYTSNPSSPVQINYEDASSKTEIFKWINIFVARRKLSGSLCFDFIEDDISGKMYCIECNPRLHSAIVLMDSRRQDACQAIYRAIENIEDGDMNVIVKPDPKQKHIYWFYNELAKLLHGENILTVLKTILTGRDAVWAWDDPLPFFLLPHLQITSQLLEAALNDKPWDMINYCLGQLR